VRFWWTSKFFHHIYCIIKAWTSLTIYSPHLLLGTLLNEERESTGDWKIFVTNLCPICVRHHISLCWCKPWWFHGWI
jgi:hypothetical protein